MAKLCFTGSANLCFPHTQLFGVAFDQHAAQTSDVGCLKHSGTDGSGVAVRLSKLVATRKSLPNPVVCTLPILG
jgi:hypothetical protein